MNIKAIALDLDGTLLNSKKEISHKNLEILSKLSKSGIKIIIVTGRTYVSSKKYLDMIPYKTTAITYNGAKIIDTVNDNVIQEIKVDGEIVKQIISLARENDFHINLYKDNKWYIEKEDDESIHYAKTTGLSPVICNFDTLEDFSMTKVTIQNMENSKEYNEFCQMISEKFKDSIYTAKSQTFLFEILNKNVNKGIILKKVLNSMEISSDECIAFGDAMNDFEMLNTVGIGVAMGNSVPELLNKMNYSTDTNDNDGVGVFLEKYFFDTTRKL